LLSARDMRLALSIGLALALAGVPATTVTAGLEPGTDELRAGMCDGFDGLSFVFCVAFCEARECDRQGAGDDRCDVLARGFSRVSGGASLPCSASPPHPTI
jgi:hypothetical protein